MRYLDALNRLTEIVPTVEDFIKKYPGTQTAFAAKNVSLPFLVQEKKFAEAINRANEFLQNKKYPTKEALYTHLLANTYDFRSNSKAGSDRNNAVMYYNTLTTKFSNSDLAAWAQMRLKELSGSSGGSMRLNEATEIEKVIPESYLLFQNYPNPFNPTTTIEYEVANAGPVRLAVHDVLGRHIRTLVDGRQQIGRFRVVWDGIDEHGIPVAAGLYFCRMQAGEFAGTIKLALMK